MANNPQFKINQIAKDLGKKSKDIVEILVSKGVDAIICVPKDAAACMTAVAEANAAGIPFIWAAYGFGSPSGYDQKIETFEDLLSL